MSTPHPLAEIRHHHRLTVWDLDRLTDIPADVYIEIEAGRREPSPKVYGCLATLGLDVADLSRADVAWANARQRADRDAIQAGDHAPHLAAI